MTTEALLKDINDRLTAIGESVSEERITNIVTQYLQGLNDDDPFVRKMRFGNGGEKKLLGTKYARWNLTAADVEFLYDLQVALQGQKRVGGGGVYQGPSEELSNTFKAISDAVYMTPDEVRATDIKALDEEFQRVPKVALRGRDQALQEAGLWHLTSAYQNAVRAMDTAESGYGSQLVGAQYVGDLWEAARKEMRVASLIDTFEMTAPTAYLPVEVDFPEMLVFAESTSSSASNYTTSKTGSQRVTVTAKKFGIHQMWSGEMEEDSIIAFIPFLRRQAMLSLAYYQDSAVLNGDTTLTNGINASDTSLTVEAITAWDGIRHAGLVDNTGNSASAANGPISLELFKAIYGRMLDATYLHDWGHPNNPNDLIHVVDPYVADAMLLLDDIRTLDKYGPAATILTGEVARIYGHPVISDIAVKKSTTTGYVDADTPGNNLYGQVVSFNRNGCKIGWRRRVQLETERLPATDQTRLVYTLRQGFGRFTPTGAASGIEWADEIYYINL